MNAQQYQRGDIVRLLAYRGEILTRRVWTDGGGRGVAICSERDYQLALRGQQPRCVGWPREDVLGLGAPPTDHAATGGQE